MNEDLTELVLNRTWRPALSVTGIGGMPPLESAGNVLRPQTSVKLSLRLPPTADGKTCGELLKEALLRDPPNGAQVTLDLEKASTGWNAPAMAPWLTKAIDEASQTFFGGRVVRRGCACVVLWPAAPPSPIGAWTASAAPAADSIATTSRATGRARRMGSTLRVVRVGRLDVLDQRGLGRHQPVGLLTPVAAAQRDGEGVAVAALQLPGPAGHAGLDAPDAPTPGR